MNHPLIDQIIDGMTRLKDAWVGIGSFSKQGVFAVAIVLTFILSLRGDQQPPPLNSGPETGSEVSSFYVRAVTGPLAGKSVCYVCRNGDRPVVMVFLRDLGTDATRLLKQLDATVNQHRAEGLRCFVVLLSEATLKDSARLQTVAFDQKLDLPLTLAAESLTGAVSKTIDPNAAVTVVMYDHLKVTSRFSYRSGECDDPACKTIISAAVKLAKDSSK